MYNANKLRWKQLLIDFITFALLYNIIDFKIILLQTRKYYLSEL